MRRITLKNRNRGSVLLLTAILLLVLIGVAALAVDVSRLHVAKQQTQNVCDACALAGAWQLEPASGGLQNTAISAAQDCATANNESQNLKVLQPGTDSEGISVTQVDRMSISVKGEAEVEFGFARIFGSDDNYQKDRVASSATAVLEKNPGFKYPLIPLPIDYFRLQNLISKSPTLTAQQTLYTEWWHEKENVRSEDQDLCTAVLNGADTLGAYQSQFAESAPAFRLDIGGTAKRRTENPIQSTLLGLNSRLKGDNLTFESWTQLSAAQKAAFRAPQHFVILPVIDFGSSDPNELLIVGFAGFYIESAAYKTLKAGTKVEEYIEITGHFVPGVVGPKSVHWLLPFEQAAEETNLIYRVRLTN